ncbi:hypothetical protein J6590_053404 [Homalodisca vitripennis]|nr:hypothetical protein J6590_053404 [Homalodisca vitripennis]
MADSMLFMSPDFLTKFIDEYRDLPCLWKVRIEEYSNTLQRYKAWEHLQITKEKVPNADLNFVKNKVDNIRASFRKELRKIRDCTRSGASSDDTYPQLYGTLNSLSSPQIGSSLEKQRAIRMRLNRMFLKGKTVLLSIELGYSALLFARRKLCRTTQGSSTTSTFERGEKELRQRKAILEKASAVLNKADDEYDDLGKRYAEKLHRMPASQRDIADKLIDHIPLFFSSFLNTPTSSNTTTAAATCLERLILTTERDEQDT